MEKKELITSWGDVPVVMDLYYAARILGFEAETLRVYSRKGKFPAFKAGDDEWRVEKEDLKKWINDRKTS